MSVYPLELYATFPAGTWRFEIKGVALMDFQGEHVFPTEHGVFFRHPPGVPSQEWRTSYFPWHKVERAYTVKEGNGNEQGKDSGNGSGNGVVPEESGDGGNGPGNRGSAEPGKDSGTGGDNSSAGAGSTD